MSDVYQLPKYYFAWLDGRDNVWAAGFLNQESYQKVIQENNLYGKRVTEKFLAPSLKKAFEIGSKMLEDEIIPF